MMPKSLCCVVAWLAVVALVDKVQCENASLMDPAVVVDGYRSFANIWNRELQKATDAVLGDISKTLRGNKDTWELEYIHTEAFKASSAAKFSILIEDSDLHVREFRGYSGNKKNKFGWSALTGVQAPSVEEDGNNGSGPWSPRIEDVSIHGPADLYVDEKSEEMSLRVPHLVETGAVSRVRVEKGVQVSVIGPASLQLKKPVEVDFELPLSKKASVSLLDRIRSQAEFSLKDVMGIVSEKKSDKLKVKKIGKNEVALQVPSKELSIRKKKNDDDGHEKVIGQIHSILPTISDVYMHHVQEASKSKNNLVAVPKLKAKRIISADIQAVLMYEYPVSLVDKNTNDQGERALIDIVVLKDVEGNYTLAHVAPREIFNTVTMPNNRGNATYAPSEIEFNDIGLVVSSPF